MNTIPESEERQKMPPKSVFKQEATLIWDFQNATQEEMDIVAVSVLKRISIKQSHELRKKNKRVFNNWWRQFWFYTGNWMKKRPPPPPDGWIQRVILTQPAMREGEWRPEGWWERFSTCPLAGKQWKPICRVLPSLAEVKELNKNVII